MFTNVSLVYETRLFNYLRVGLPVVVTRIVGDDSVATLAESEDTRSVAGESRVEVDGFSSVLVWFFLVPVQ